MRIDPEEVEEPVAAEGDLEIGRINCCFRWRGRNPVQEEITRIINSRKAARAVAVSRPNRMRDPGNGLERGGGGGIK
jgi:hypothetical protein